MKKLITLVVFVIIATVANAQFKKGTYMISGDLSGSYNKETVKWDGVKDKGERTTLGLGAGVGYFIKKNISVGGKLAYTSSKTEYGGKSTGESGRTELTAFLRYYFGKPKLSSFIPYVEGRLGYLINVTGEGDENKETGIAYGGVVGANYFLTKHIGLDAGIEYMMSKVKNAADSNNKQDVTRLQLKVGVIIMLDF